MKRLVAIATVLAGAAVTGSPAWAQYPPACANPPVVILGAPMPSATPFEGNRYSLYQPPTFSGNFLAPSYTAPRLYNPRYIPPGPYWYTPTFPYTPSYYGYYYTPGYFRY